jgi:hypothetical protein
MEEGEEKEIAPAEGGEVLPSEQRGVAITNSLSEAAVLVLLDGVLFFLLSVEVIAVVVLTLFSRPTVEGEGRGGEGTETGVGEQTWGGGEREGEGAEKGELLRPRLEKNFFLASHTTGHSE